MKLMTSYECKGIEKRIKKVAINLLFDGMDIQKVAELTGLREKEVKELKNQQIGIDTVTGCDYGAIQAENV